MTLEEKIGQMLCFGWSGETEEDGLTYSAHAREVVEDMRVGGIILMRRNVSPPYRRTAETLNELQSRSKLPLLIAADQENGSVAQFQDPVTVFASNMAIGATRSADYARRAAAATAEELKAIGVNWNFAPAVDVNINPDNPIIGIRSFGESTELVSELGAAAVAGCQGGGVMACAKHFPGHGDTAVDSHLALPVVLHGMDRLRAVELAPFAAAIQAGVDSIMTAHIMFPAFDDQRPATLSKPVIASLLRGEMGFQGVVVTDCLEMKGIVGGYGIGEAGVLAVEAGVDVLLVCHTLSRQREVREAVLRAVRDGRIPEGRIEESVGRILALKENYRLVERRAVDVEKLAGRLGRPEHRALQREIAESSVTLVRDREKLLPLRLCERCNVVVAGLHASVEPLAQAIRTHHPSVEAIVASAAEMDRAVEAASTAAAAVVVTCPKEPWTKPLDQHAQTELVKRVHSSGVPTVVVAVREPYDLRAFPEVGTYIATYGYRPESLDAAGKLILGLIRPSGSLPVTIPG